MAIVAGYLKRARTIQGKIGARKQRGVRFIGSLFQKILRTIRKRVARTLSKSDKTFIGFFHIKGRPIRPMDTHTR